MTFFIRIDNAVVRFRVQFEKKHARVSFSERSKLHESKGRVGFEVFQKLTIFTSDFPGGKRNLIMKIRAPHNTLNRAIHTNIYIYESFNKSDVSS